MFPSPERSDAHAADETDDYSISPQSAHHSTQKSDIKPDKTAVSQPNPHLTRNQAHQQRIILPPTSSYFAYTNTLPFFSLLSAALPLDPIEPQKYQEAVSFNNPDRAKWIEAMRIEMKSLLENETWELIQTSLTVKTISVEWVFKLKRGKDGEITRLKT